MPNITANGIGIEYDTFGDPSSPALLLIQGLGAQMILWPDEFCKLLAHQGLNVIRFDNRDVGLSSKFDKHSDQDLADIFTNPQCGASLSIPYTLNDMADDAVALLDALGIKKAHICGVSMGGMIAQTIAIRHPSRVISFISMSSGTGDPSLPWGKPEAMAAIIAPAPTERDASIEHSIRIFRMISGSKYPFNEERMRPLIERCCNRCHYPPGMLRHSIAVMTAGDRTQALRSVTVPTLVIHGSEDPLLSVEQGRATAASVPGAELLIIEGMGHDLPAAVWPLIVEAIAQHTRKALIRSGQK